MLQGIDEDVTSVVTPDEKQQYEISAVAAPVPTMDDLMKIKTMEDYRNLKPSPNNYFTARNFVPIPPFMLNTIYQSIRKKVILHKV